MPEMPEVESLARWLDDRTRGLCIARVDVLSISALKTFTPPIDALRGAVVHGWSRRGKFLVCRTSSASPGEDGKTLYLCVHLARAGWLRWQEEIKVGPAKLGRGPGALRVQLSDGSGFTATEAGTEKRLSVHVVHDPDEVEHIRTLGVDPLGAEFTADLLAGLLRDAGRAQLKGVITDQSAISGVGNAYSDEALHVAKLSPFKPASSLTPDETKTLRDAVVTVLAEAIARSAGKPAAELKDAKRGGLRVHGRAGQPCPVCGASVREVAFATKSLQYCPTCQTGGKPLADRRLSRLLK